MEQDRVNKGFGVSTDISSVALEAVQKAADRGGTV
jgi:hypothetical protein